MNGRVAAIAAALAVDGVLGDGHVSWHPVALVGRALDLCYRPWRRGPAARQFVGGTAALAAAAAAVGAGAWAAERLADRLPGGALLLGAALKPTFAARQLIGDVLAVGAALEADDLGLARDRVSRLVSRPVAGLPAGLVAAAAIESLAENLADSVVAPLGWFVVAGLPGAAVYRVVNTADAMFGYRDEREWLGKSAARVDDLLNLVPSRAAALALVAAAGALSGPRAAARAGATALRDGGSTASPNAGWPMAAMAGALGRRLEKRGHYVLGGSFPEPEAGDVRRAVRLATAATALVSAAAITAAGVQASTRRRARPSAAPRWRCT